VHRQQMRANGVIILLLGVGCSVYVCMCEWVCVSCICICMSVSVNVISVHVHCQYLNKSVQYISFLMMDTRVCIMQYTCVYVCVCACVCDSVLRVLNQSMSVLLSHVQHTQRACSIQCQDLKYHKAFISIQSDLICTDS
jgi:hypothetical protein